MLRVAHEIGPKEAPIVTPEAGAFVEKLARKFAPKLEELLLARKDYYRQVREGKTPDFLESTKQIRSGDWQVAKPPKYLEDRRVEITSPASPKMVVNALNSDAKVYMACFEDALSPTWDNLIAGHTAIKGAVRRDYEFTDKRSNKTYKLDKNYTTSLMIRPRGLHMKAKHMILDGSPIPGALMEFGFFVFHNGKILVEQGLNPCLYLPKMEHYQEAAWWNEVFNFAEEELGLPKNCIKATALIETFPAVFEMDEILYSLKDRILGLNCGRWDYIFSFIKTMGLEKNHILPDRSSITMQTAFMKAYSRLLIDTCHKRGAHAMGGMSAFIPVPGDQELNDKAYQAVVADKEFEANAGHDGTWVAHPALIEVAQKVFDEVMPKPNQKEVISDEKIDNQKLFEPLKGDITLNGIDNNIQVALRYISAWYAGLGAVPIFNMMEDAATAEIARTQLWQWVNLDGVKAKDGSNLVEVNEELFNSRLDKVFAEIKSEWKDQSPAEYLELSYKLLKKLVNDQQMADFLTTIAYDELPGDGVE